MTPTREEREQLAASDYERGAASAERMAQGPEMNDEAAEYFQKNAHEQTLIASALRAQIAAMDAVPVAWVVKDFADGHVPYPTEDFARNSFEAQECGGRVMPAYLAPPSAAAIRNAALEDGATKIEAVKFLLSLPSPEDGPFTNQQRTIDEVVEQAAAAVRALKEAE